MVGRIFLWFGFFFSQKRNELAAAKLRLKSLDLKPKTALWETQGLIL
ncbi:MAG: hypothetical protein OFPII_40460 [Osedax symbiont Rs1]|nr:MAG: hypothetical protein OFPII_40460 [Osedax symbiont Rs1]